MYIKVLVLAFLSLLISGCNYDEYRLGDINDGTSKFILFNRVEGGYLYNDKGLVSIESFNQVDGCPNLGIDNDLNVFGDFEEDGICQYRYKKKIYNKTYEGDLTVVALSDSNFTLQPIRKIIYSNRKELIDISEFNNTLDGYYLENTIKVIGGGVAVFNPGSKVFEFEPNGQGLKKIYYSVINDSTGVRLIGYIEIISVDGVDIIDLENISISSSVSEVEVNLEDYYSTNDIGQYQVISVNETNGYANIPNLNLEDINNKRFVVSSYSPGTYYIFVTISNLYGDVGTSVIEVKFI